MTSGEALGPWETARRGFSSVVMPGILALAAVAFGACSPAPRPLEWGVRFASPADRARAVWVEAAIRTGSCTGPVVFSDEISVASGTGMVMPARLHAGHYAITGRARDASCAWFASGCLEIDLPAEGRAIVDLVAGTETAACAASDCTAGRCAGLDAGTPDGSMRDAGMVDAAMLDVGIVDVGMVDSSIPDGGMPDTSLRDTGPAPDACAPTTEVCNGRNDDCDANVDEGFDLTSDPNNCGMCGQDCGGSPASCMASNCVCPSPLTWSSFRRECIDLTRDPQNCGSLGNDCNSDEMCTASSCVCRPGLTRSGGSCVDLQSSPSNCGTLGFACTSPQVCSGGTCTATCAGTLTSCSRACVDTETDSRNCGGCSNRCDPQDVCVGGECRGYDPALLCTSCSGCTACSGSTCCSYGTSGPYCVHGSGGACP